MSSQMTGKRLLLIALNEFSVELLEQGTRDLDLANIRQLLAMRATLTTTDDRIEHHGLDPWVQWVSVHTGQPSAVHKVLHLGDTPARLGNEQLWEVLSRRGVSSGIWGAMNATRGSARECKFFLPDPWTFSEPGYPRAIGDLLALPRYYSRNYLDVSMVEFAKGVLRLGKYALGSGALIQLVGLLPLSLRGLFKNGLNNAVLFSLFDMFSTSLFIARRRRETPQFSLIFLNSIAHLQHHRWRGGSRLNEDLRFGLQAIDRVLGMLFASRVDGEAILVMNALTQRNVSEEAPLFGYRQISPTAFLHAVDLAPARVEQLMTNDAHVFFRTTAERARAIEALSAAAIDGKPLFQVEADPDDPLKLFYQIVFWDHLPAEQLVVINGSSVRFFDHFDILGIRTGAHVPQGQAFSEGISLPGSIYNHQIADHVLEYFDIRPAMNVAEASRKLP